MTHSILLDGNSLTRDQVAAIARGGVGVDLDAKQLSRVRSAADFLAEKVRCGEPIYGVTTGFGSNADKLLGAHRVRDELPGGNPEPRCRVQDRRTRNARMARSADLTGKAKIVFQCQTT